ETVFNAQPLITIQPKVDGLRLVNITIDGDELQYFFTGVGGDYGFGSGNTGDSGEFELIGGVAVATGGQSVAGDSVDNTDPLNPVVNAIPLTGTEVGSPVTGDIEMGDAIRIYIPSGEGGFYLGNLEDDNSYIAVGDDIQIGVKNLSSSRGLQGT